MINKLETFYYVPIPFDYSCSLNIRYPYYHFTRMIKKLDHQLDTSDENKKIESSPSSACVAATTAEAMPATTMIVLSIVMTSLTKAVLRLQNHFLVPRLKMMLMILCITIHKLPKIKVRKAPNQWIFCTTVSSFVK